MSFHTVTFLILYASCLLERFRTITKLPCILDLWKYPAFTIEWTQQAVPQTGRRTRIWTQTNAFGEHYATITPFSYIYDNCNSLYLPPSRNEIKAVWHTVIFGQAYYFTSFMLIRKMVGRVRFELTNPLENSFTDCLL